MSLTEWPCAANRNAASATKGLLLCPCDQPMISSSAQNVEARNRAAKSRAHEDIGRKMIAGRIAFHGCQTTSNRGTTYGLADNSGTEIALS